MIDGVFLTEEAEPAFRAGRQAKVPYMIGANDREFGFFAPPPDRADGDVRAVRRRQGQGAARLRSGGHEQGRGGGAADERSGDGGAGAAAGAPDGAGVQPTYAYRFSYVASSLRARRRARCTRPRSRSCSRPCRRSTRARRRRTTSRSARRRTPTGWRSPRPAIRTAPAVRGGRSTPPTGRDHGLHGRGAEARARPAPRPARLRRSTGLDAAEAVTRAGGSYAARRVRRRSSRAPRGGR